MTNIRRSPMTNFSRSAPVISTVASSNSSRICIAAEIAAFAFMNVTLDEYEPRSTGEVSDSLDLILIKSRGRPKTSATDCATTVSEPCPMSAAPV